MNTRHRPTRAIPSSSLVRMVIRISRARWFSFLRRVFHYQNESRSDLSSNPFNSSTWMLMEFIVLVIQISIITSTIAIFKEKHVWPMRIWIIGYNIGCVLSLFLLYGRYRRHLNPQDGFGLSDVEQQRGSEESRISYLMNKCRTSLEGFFALWFVMGNVWIFDSRFRSFHRAPKLHVLCISLLAWNAICYSFPFLLSLLLCCCVPMISNLLGYNMNAGSIDRGASEEEISQLPSFPASDLANDHPECCICITNYLDREELRRLPCSHVFHLKCIDQWLQITSSCPLCKQEVGRYCLVFHGTNNASFIRNLLVP